ncbi:MAG: cupin domain-containing protein [Halorientalis sp.]
MRVNQADLEWTETDRGETAFRRKQLAAAAGGEDIGCSLYELPPGMRSWPFHYHEGNEEAIYVLAGTGTVRLADGAEPLEPGDYVALPAGDGGGHRVVNDGDDPLRYLAVSTMNDPDVVVYPEMEKVGVYTGTPPGRHEGRRLTKYFPADADVEYWPGESD